MVVFYKPDFPFDLYLNLKDLTRQPFGLTERLDGDRYQTMIANELVTITQDPDSNELAIEIPDNKPELKHQFLTEIKRRFGLNHDLNAFHKFAKKDPHLSPVIDRLKGLTLFQKSTPFEMLVTAITDQQLNVSFATTLKHRLITHYGKKHNIDGIELWEFSTPERLAKLPENALRPLQYSGSKSRYIIHLAKGVVKGDYPLETWSGLKDDELLKALMTVYGVGRWTAEYTALVGYDRCDITPAADIGLMNAVQRCYQLAERPNENQVREIAESWRPWRGLVTYYLWYAFE